MNVFLHWMLWKSALANWASIPVSQNGTSDGMLSTKGRAIVHQCLTALSAQSWPQQKALTGNDGVDIG